MNEQSGDGLSELRNSFNLRENLGKVATRIAIGILVVWLVITAIIIWWWSPDKFGTIGDSFGAVNALFSGLALAGVVLAILLQNEDLQNQERAMQLQTKEMKDTTEALEAQTKLLDAQVRHSGQQQFDARFFEAVRFIRNSFDQLSVLFPNQHESRGAAAVSQLSGILRTTMRPSFNPPDFRHQFAKFERDYGRHYQPALQMLEVVIQMLTTVADTHLHETYLKN